jgi:hypothetical protein
MSTAGFGFAFPYPPDSQITYAQYLITRYALTTGLPAALAVLTLMFGMK